MKELNITTDIHLCAHIGSHHAMLTRCNQIPHRLNEQEQHEQKMNYYNDAKQCNASQHKWNINSNFEEKQKTGENIIINNIQIYYRLEMFAWIHRPRFLEELMVAQISSNFMMIFSSVDIQCICNFICMNVLCYSM